MIATTAGALPGASLVTGDPATPITGVQIDSRAVGPGDLFVAIAGGHAFTDAARAAGAAAVLVAAERAAGEPGVVLAAPDPVAALAAIGAANAAAATGCAVVGITGSSGKTSTKDVLAALCGEARRTIAAASGHNNEIGLPLTLTRIGADTEVAICELAMRGPGQIAELAELARPRVGVVTNVGTAHIGLLGSREAIAAAKGELLTALPEGGAAVVPHDEPLLANWLRAGLRVLTFGEEEDADVRLEARAPLPNGTHATYRVEGRRLDLDLPLEGRHQALNVAAALAAAHALGLPLDAVAAGAARIVLQPWRGEVHELPGGGVAINDAYNANPASVEAALEHLAERPVAGRRIAVLGEMAELGAESAALHRQVGAAVAAHGIDLLIVVGPGALGYLDGARGVEAVVVDDPGRLVERLSTLVRPGDAVLVKASRSVGLEAVAAGVVWALANADRP